MGTVAPERRRVNGKALLDEAVRAGITALQQVMETRLNQIMDAAVTHVLGRGHHVRRRDVPHYIEQEGACRRCGTRESRRFSRNGHRQRRLLTQWGELEIGLPRVVCECGGSVALAFEGLLRPYQRTSDAVDAQIQRWGAMGVSLRQLQTELARTFIGPLGLQTLLNRLQHIPAEIGDQMGRGIPPILEVDAIWITQLRSNGTFRRDAKGRMRAVKGRFKRPLFLAMGIWPEEGRCALLAWQLGESESADEWVSFLARLEADGIRGDNGLRLIIHDGGSGLCRGLRTVHFDAVTQRCLFHRLRNIARAIELPEGLSRKQRTRKRKAVLRDFGTIWAAKRYDTMLRRYVKIVRQYRHSQPQAVAILRRNFRDTVTFYQIESQHPGWERQFLRTTSHLERFNRRLRRRARLANAYHSDEGLLAMVAQEVALAA